MSRPPTSSFNRWFLICLFVLECGDPCANTPDPAYSCIKNSSVVNIAMWCTVRCTSISLNQNTHDFKCVASHLPPKKTRLKVGRQKGLKWTSRTKKSSLEVFKWLSIDIKLPKQHPLIPSGGAPRTRYQGDGRKRWLHWKGHPSCINILLVSNCFDDAKSQCISIRRRTKTTQYIEYLSWIKCDIPKCSNQTTSIRKEDQTDMSTFFTLHPK